MLALRDSAARDFLLEQNWRETLAQMPDSELLVRILEADLRPDDPASLNGFMASLSAEQEALVSAWLLQKVPPNPDAVVRGWWDGLRQSALRRQLHAAESRMRLPQLATGEVVTLQKQVVDLRKQLDEISRLSSARVLER